MKKLFEIVKILDMEAIQVGEEEEFRFRLEILRDMDSNLFYGKIYRLESYRLNPSFPQLSGELPNFMHDALIYVIDDNFNLDDMKASSSDDVVKIFRNLLTDRFGNLV